MQFRQELVLELVKKTTHMHFMTRPYFLQKK